MLFERARSGCHSVFVACNMIMMCSAGTAEAHLYAAVTLETLQLAWPR